MFLRPLRFVFLDDLDLTAFPWADRVTDRAPWWMRGHFVWQRDFARRCWPVPRKPSKHRR